MVDEAMARNGDRLEAAVRVLGVGVGGWGANLDELLDQWGTAGVCLLLRVFRGSEHGAGDAGSHRKQQEVVAVYSPPTH